MGYTTDHERPTDVEFGIIGALLTSPDLVGQIADILLPSDFGHPEAQTVFANILSAWEHGEASDLISMATMSNMPDVGRLKEITLEAWASSSITSYAQTIVTSARLRRAHEKAVEVSDQISRGVITDPDIAFQTLSEAVEEDGADHRNIDGPLAIPVADFLAQSEALEASGQWIVPGLIRRRWRIVVAGEEGIGKMVLLRQIGYSVAAGVHPFNQNQPIEPARALFIDLENGRDVIDDQTKIVNLQGRDLVTEAEDRLLIHSNEAGMNILNPADRRKFERIVNEAQPDLLIIGPLYKLAIRNGAKADWDADAMAVINFLDQIRTRYDCALMLEHHLVGGSGSSNDRIRSINQAGSANFRRWPEMSYSLVEDLDAVNVDGADVVKMVRYRRPRVDDRGWPDTITKRMGTSTAHAWRATFRSSLS